MWLKFQRVSVLLFIASPQLKRMKGLTIEVCGLQPWSLLIAFPVGSQGKGELPSCPSSSRNLITFHTMHKNTSTKTPIPTLSVLLNLAPPSSAPSISRFFLPLSSTVPPSWRYAQALIGPSFFFDLWYTQHFLSRLWRPALCSIKTAVIFLVLIYKRKVWMLFYAI